jgi:hypothetical protein
MAKRTVRDFAAGGDVGPAVDAWAKDAGYRLKETRDGTRVFQKGTGFLVAPMMLSVRQEQGEVHVEAWIRANLFVRLMSLFILPAEMGVESGGMRAVLPRKIARGQVNKLLEALGQPPIP